MSKLDLYVQPSKYGKDECSISYALEAGPDKGAEGSSLTLVVTTTIETGPHQGTPPHVTRHRILATDVVEFIEKHGFLDAQA